ncbi:MAG TPA: peptide ligase PGM1-related protein [Actinomycetota bacterium]|nr:peptide ligase PGM1-related protein [Actinomycetota bacterium]
MSSSHPDRFEALQQRLAALGSRALSDLDRGCIVVLPSLTFPVEELRKIIGISRYEERLLCLVLLLDQPELEVVFVTSLPVDPVVVDYYLSFLRDPAGGRRRLTMVSLDDPDPRPLSEKLLQQPAAMDRLRAAIDRKDAYLLPFTVTAAERAIATEIGTPLYGARPGLAYAGSKSGSRHVAREAGVEVLPGSEDLHSVEALNAAIELLRHDHADVTEVVIKLNYGFSGQGNVVVNLADWNGSVLYAPTAFCAGEESWDSFIPKIERDGGIVEEMVRDDTMHSPSVQLRVGVDGSVEIVSTHDQVLGGPDDQVYLGCRFPAQASYRAEIQQAGERIAKILAAKGVVGSFGIDLLVRRGDRDLDVYLSEINLRLGGTSHPFYMARFATGGTYDAATGELLVDGSPRAYVATDNLKSEAYKGLPAARLLEELRARELAFDPSSRTGVTLHLLGTLSEHGKLGATCIALSIAAADDLYADLVATLDELTS